MEIPKQFEPQQIENKWYEQWMKHQLFRSVPDERKPYTILIPPPNVTGVLHMGHMLNNTIQDILIRRARMQGYNACWVPGTDHASIATEAKVVQKLRKQGLTKQDVGREEFLRHAWEWKEEYGGIILKQLRRLGASCDWERTRFTMEPKLSEAVVKVFVDLFNKGYLYRDLKMVNWDPKAQTTLSNEEVIYKEEQSKLYHIRYKLAGNDNEWITIATTRPETILGDTAICVHPDDERYTHLKGANALVPLIHREIPIIFDEYVDKEFGTGALKVTPAHDANDYELGQRHKLETVDTLNADGTLSAAAQLYIGQDRFIVRKQIVLDLEAAGHIVKAEEMTNKVGYSERNPDTVIEPRLSLQWYVDMQKLAGPALENVMNDEIRFFPDKFKNTYKHWMENIRDWPISRQLWWGQRIPAWYLQNGDIVVAENEEEALAKARALTGNPNFSSADMKQDEDVVDTWFSSWLWPISVFDGFENKKELDYYYPTTVLVTGWDIIFFWVARMIMAGYEFMGEKPFKDVYFTGMVRDKQRRKMSKSLGNSPDALELIDKFGADGVRVGMLLSSAAGNDLLFDDKLCEQGSNFGIKIWNALRLVKGWEPEDKPMSPAEMEAARLFEAKLAKTITELEDSFGQYRLSEALMTVYKLIWDDYCAWYLEMVKPPFGQKPSKASVEKAIALMEELMKLLHPFMPFLTEEVWHQLAERGEKDFVCIAEWPKLLTVADSDLQSWAMVQEVTTEIRNLRKQKNIPNKETLELLLMGEGMAQATFSLLSRLNNLSEIRTTTEKPEGTLSFRTSGMEFFIPIKADTLNVEDEIAKLKAELAYQQGFIDIVMKKLGNERFMQSAPPQVIESEQRKKADAEQKIAAIKQQMDSFAKL